MKNRETERVEKLSEGGEMKNRDKQSDLNRDVGSDEQSRSPAEEFGSSPGRRSGTTEESSNMSRDEKSPNRSGSLGNSGDRSSEGRH